MKAGQLEEPASTTALAIRLGITPSAVNQHLQVLTKAGLLTSTRQGHSVLYAWTPVAKALMGVNNQLDDGPV